MSKRIIDVIDISDKNLVTKSNVLITTRYTLTVQEQRIVLLIISLIQPEDKDLVFYKIPVKKFNEIIGIKGESSYSELKNIVEKLRSRTFSIERNNGFLTTGWISSADYISGDSHIEIMIDPKLKPYLLNLKQYFTSYKLKNIIKLKSIFSIRIYELLKQFEKIKERAFEIDELKEILGIEKKYERYSDFKRKCIIKAQNELKEKTDISFTFSERKKGKKVFEIVFHIKTKAVNYGQKNGEIEIKLNSNNEYYNRLTEYFLLSPNQAQEIIDKYPTKHIDETLDYLEEKYKNEEIKNIGAYTVKAFKENIRNQKSLFDTEIEVEKNKAVEEEKIKRIKEAQANEYDNLDKDYEIYISESAKIFIEKLSEADKKELYERAEKAVKKKYDNPNFSSHYLLEREAIRLVNNNIQYLSKEEYLKENIKKYPYIRKTANTAKHLDG